MPVQLFEQNAEREGKNRGINNLRSDDRIEKRFEVFVSVEYKFKEKFQRGAEKNRRKAKEHDVHGASSEDIDGCKPRRNAEKKIYAGIETENGFGSGIAKKSRKKTKKPTGEFALINGDANAGRQNK